MDFSDHELLQVCVLVMVISFIIYFGSTIFRLILISILSLLSFIFERKWIHFD